MKLSKGYTQKDLDFVQACLIFDPTLMVDGYPHDPELLTMCPKELLEPSNKGIFHDFENGTPVGPKVKMILTLCPDFFHQLTECLYFHNEGTNAVSDYLRMLIWCASDHFNNKITFSNHWVDWYREQVKGLSNLDFFINFAVENGKTFSF